MRITAGGVYRVLAQTSAIAEVLSADGWSVVVVPPSSSTADFYRALAAAAGFPDWFGANLDALWDTLTELTGPTALIVERWTRLARAQPRDWSRILAVLEERATIAPPFAVVLA
jgi:RNAse (barnase) inhibitor barstar